MATEVRSNLFNLLNEAERINKKKYSWSAIGKKIGRSRQSTEHLFMGDQDDDSYIKYGTLGKLIDFFASEGLPVTINKLFIVIDGNAQG